jgi:NADH-quinone oxidoreductase subunit F
LYRLITDIRNGKGKEEDLEHMIMLSETMKESSFCALGQSLLLPVKSAIENFREDFLARMK